MQVMSGLRQHQNVLRLLAYCVEGNERILVYEYMHRRSLDAYIFGKPKERALLNWQMRLQIIKGIAEGVKHLYEGEGSSGSVIHRDLKPANVLLDGGWKAKVADFGTAKLLLAGATGTRTRIGTPGYMAPEYVQSEGGETTLKCDVYSFGVTLLETLSGRRNCERPSLTSELSEQSCCRPGDCGSNASLRPSLILRLHRHLPGPSLLSYAGAYRLDFFASRKSRTTGHPCLQSSRC
ncbi:putative cysteine-rich receptor-like protein kinase 39 isoform X2 [Phragmites australis]|uniref:putative cysteine-rich receptor-like protein kinase 39 isoform X2 n=1 Tax=Phragmites australis TaxID=29695 RepID=UPI002D7902BE|nr:putative cysteine-rich receptor-like protein kinase 39 isoform X2 [Phragmites australis]